MSYTKEQTQTMALLVLLGLVIAVGSYMAMIKPNLGRVGQFNESAQKWTEELTEQQRILKSNLDAVQRAEATETRTHELEAPLRHGLFAGRLTNCFSELRNAHAFSFRFQNDAERMERLSSATSADENVYHELSNQFTILGCDFYELVRFLQVVETTNPGLRVCAFQVKAHDPSNPDGRIDAQIELRLIGFKDGQDAPWESASIDTFKPERPNPFSPPGAVGIDPNASLCARLNGLCFNGTIGDGALIRPTIDGKAKLIKRGGLLPFFDEKVKLVGYTSRTLIVHVEATDIYYKLTLYTSGDNAGQVQTIEEITPR